MNVRTLTLTLALSALPTLASAECPRTADAITVATEADAIQKVNLDGAIEGYVRATQLDPKNPQLLWKLAALYKQKEAWGKVRETLATACVLAPSFANYFWLRGYATLRLVSTDKALLTDAKGMLEKAVELDSHHADAHFDLADVLQRQGDDHGALEHYTKAIEIAPNRVSYYGALVDLYRRLGYLDLALTVAREGSTWDAANFTLLTLWGAVLEEKNALPDAILKYTEAKAACGACNEHGQQIAFFNLGAALALSKPPRKADAAQNLTAFQKMICKGGAALRYANECTEAQQLLLRLQSP